MEHGNNDFFGELQQVSSRYCQEVPSAEESQNFIEGLVNLMFPFRVKTTLTREGMAEKLVLLERQLEELLTPLRPKMKDEPKAICRKFFDRMPVVFRMLLEDAEAFAKFDPAAECVEEVILCYPGFYSLAVYRCAHELYKMEVPILPRVISEYAHSRTGVDIHPGAEIGRACFIDHGTGTVIGETAVIGNYVKIYQGVTLGAMFVEKSLAKKKRHPTIEDNVIIYARSTILGGDTLVGHDTVIGGNVWLTESVLPHSVVYQKSRAAIRDSREISGQINWVI